ncbi:alpha-mannosidase [Striga asiatica]|uniref:Alpha-mannosidase n=1 Tax=Striga asiatica TaxID=4170 RepID=A0A5A7PI35_STRAF|nr:alpha-mannosidase [Striga asiatica]
MGFKIFSVVFTVCVVCVLVECKYMIYNTSHGTVPGKINVHLVSHTHDDVGWLKTVDQYYVGSNNSIQGACVQNVLDSLIPALLADKNRKFIYVEQAFFQRWWRNQSDDMKKKVRMLVKSGQLEFINGGMCMHDEATTHYIDMIDQTTLGHRFIKEEFDVIPRIGWQIDPFGHSAVQAYLLGAEVGFDALYFARIDYQDRAKRKDEKKLEVVWQGSKSLGSSSQIFTGAFKTHYSPPDGFSFEVNDDSPVVQDGRVNALYSTPSIYTDAKYKLNDSWPLKIDDFFPYLCIRYADTKNAYWTGYFTSRPAIKGYVRMMSGYYLAARQLEFFRGRNKPGGPTTDSLADALAIAQHHDAVTGTEKQHVANDYAKRLSRGYKESEDVVAESLGCLTQSLSPSKCKSPCPLLNISYCPATEVDLSQGKRLVVIVYNSLGWNRTDVVRIPVIEKSITVRDSAGNKILSQLIPIVNVSMSIRKFYGTAYMGRNSSSGPMYWLAFTAVVPPLGFSTYVITRGGSSTLIKPVSVTFDESQNGDIQVGPGNVKLIYSGINGKLAQYVNSKRSVNISLGQSFIYYSGHNGSNGTTQSSGAYIFRPNGTFGIEPERRNPLTVFKGPLFDEVHERISSWLYQITRVFKDKEHAEIEFTVGPIPIEDGVGKEIVTQIKTNIKNNKTFYTDSNGRDFLQRIRDYRADWDLQVNQPIAGNYYPINLGIYIKDKNTELSVLVDRSVGGSSIADGEVEIMLHRRLLHDDGRGVGEHLNETVCVRDSCFGLAVNGKYYLRLDTVGEGSKWRRSFGQQIYSPLLLAFTVEDESQTKFSVPTFLAMDPSYSLPDNVAIITLQELEDESVLLRLAHLYEVGEDKDLSVTATVELKKVFPNKKIKKIMEMSLSANQEREEMEKKRLSWKVESSHEKRGTNLRRSPVDPVNLVLELSPMEIRTFIIIFS